MPRKKATKAAALAAEKKYLDQDGLAHLVVIRQIKRCLFRQIKTGLSEHLTME